MVPYHPVETSPKVVPVRKRRFRIKSLMVLVALVGAGLGWVLHVDRVDRWFQADRSRFIEWANEFEQANPSLKPLARSMTASGFLLTTDYQWNQDYQTPAGGSISIQVALQAGPVSTQRRVIFESPGRTVTWPFEDIERGRKVDLKAEFPGAFR